MAAVDETAGAHVERVEAALEALESLPDPAAADAGLGAVQALLELYGEGLGRVLAHVDSDALTALAEDELVAHLLLLHGLHPEPVQARVARGLDEVRPFLASHGGGVELVEVADGVARLRLEGTCDGCPASAATLTHAVEEAVHRAAPEIERVEAEGAGESAGTGEPAAFTDADCPAGPSLPMAGGGSGAATPAAGPSLPLVQQPAAPPSPRRA